MAYKNLQPLEKIENLKKIIIGLVNLKLWIVIFVKKE